MSNISLEVKIITHPIREERADRLAEIIALHAPVTIYVDDDGAGAKANHLTALSEPSPASHVLILEDDAIPCEGWYQWVLKWISQAPTALISFYLGSGRPVFAQRNVDLLLKDMALQPEASISLPRLLHGVAYCVPAFSSKGFQEAQVITQQADKAVGEIWKSLAIGPIIYPIYSAFEHDDLPSVINYSRPPIKRNARFLIGNKIGI